MASENRVVATVMSMTPARSSPAMVAREALRRNGTESSGADPTIKAGRRAIA